MDRECIKIRLFRAISGKIQEDFAAEIGTYPSTLAQWELGLHGPSPGAVERAAAAVGLTSKLGDQILEEIETHRLKRQRPGEGAGELLARLGSAAETSARQAVHRLASLPLGLVQPKPEHQLQAREQLERLAALDPAPRLAVVRLGRDYQAWALCIEAGERSAEAASKDPEEAARWARLAGEFAALVEEPPGWPEAVRSRAAGYEANALRFRGRLREARAALEEAKRLAGTGADPFGVLDPGRLLDLEASLCRDERRFPEALKIHDQAIAASRCRARALIKKGFTLTVMGDHEQAIETLRQAGPHVHAEGDSRLAYMWRFNLAVSLMRLSRFEEAAEHLPEVRHLAAERGDEIELIRVTWLEGHLLAGQGRRPAARFYLEQARARFEAKKLWYDAALAGLELAGLLLEEGQTAEVKAMAETLTAAFEAEGVHAEAAKALRLFQQAVDREEASAELARRVLGYLFRARHDPELRFAA